MHSPAVSVILPTYNRAGTLLRALQSVYAQTFTDHEIIVVDDGSTDDTKRVLADQARRYRLRWAHIPNSGPASARNRGIALARGRWIAFLDSDDSWTPDKLSQQVHALESTRAGLTHCDMLRILPDRRTRLLKTPRVIKGHTLDQHGLDWQTKGIGIQSVMVDAELLRASGGFDTRLRALEDLDLLLRLSRQVDFVALTLPLVLYYAGPGVSTERLAVARARRRLLAKHGAGLKGSPRALAYQCGKIAMAYLRAGHRHEARRFARLALATAPWSIRIAAPALIPRFGLTGALSLLLKLEQAAGRD